MSPTGVVTDAELSRARANPAFRHQLAAENLEFLLGRLNDLRGFESNAKHARQISEGVKLAVKLADLLQQIARKHPGIAGVS
jgi:hypothetical protein